MTASYFARCGLPHHSVYHTHRERTGFLPSSAPRGRGGRVDIVISDASVRHTLVDIVIACPIRRDLMERAAKQDLVPRMPQMLQMPQMRSEGRKPTIGIAELGRNLCPLLLRRTVHCLIDRIDFWSSVQR